MISTLLEKVVETVLRCKIWEEYEGGKRLVVWEESGTVCIEVEGGRYGAA